MYLRYLVFLLTITVLRAAPVPRWEVTQKWQVPAFIVVLSDPDDNTLGLEVMYTPRLLPNGSITGQWSFSALSLELSDGPGNIHMLQCGTMACAFESNNSDVDFFSINTTWSARNYSSTWEVKDPDNTIYIFKHHVLRVITRGERLWLVKKSSELLWLFEEQNSSQLFSVGYTSEGNIAKVESQTGTWIFRYNEVKQLHTIVGPSFTAAFRYNQQGLLVSGICGTTFDLDWKSVSTTDGRLGLMKKSVLVITSANTRRFLYKTDYLGSEPDPIDKNTALSL